MAREVTGRPLVLVFCYCYHGSVDEALAIAGPEGNTVSREGNVGPAVDPGQTTRAIEFNDVAALEAALADGQVACVLAEPAIATRLNATGQVVVPGNAAEFSAAIEEQRAALAASAQALGIKPK